MNILLIGEWDDRDLHLLRRALQLRGADVYWLRLGLPANAYAITWVLGNTPSISVDGVEFGQESVDCAQSVLFKMARMDQRPPVICEGGTAEENAFATKEWQAAMFGALQQLLDSAPCRVLGSPRDLTWHDWKPYALARATSMGIKVPHSTISTRVASSLDPAGSYVAKAINANPLIAPDRYYPTTLLDPRVLSELLEASLDVPSLLQTAIGRHYEVRSVLLGDEVIERALHAPSNQPVDIKYAARVRVDVLDSRPVTSSLVRLARELPLSYCCFDTIVDTEGEEWLVDITPRGSWHWLEKSDASSITNDIADNLLKRKE